MNILVTGGTGTVGSQVVQNLSGADHSVKVLTRDASKKSSLPVGVDAVEGDLSQAATVRRVFDGVDAVFLLNTVSLTEASEALMAISGMRVAGVKRVVYLSVHEADRRRSRHRRSGKSGGRRHTWRRSGTPGCATARWIPKAA